MEALLLSNLVQGGIVAGAVRIEQGVPVHRYKKEIIRCGEYYKEADKLAFTVTPEVLDHWQNTFREWTAAGNKVPVPETHDGAQDPSKNRGWVVDLFREGDSLFAIVDLYGADAPKVAMTNDVSIFSPASSVDGNGKTYIRPITHVALCTDPVIPGLGGFEAVAASRKKIQMNKESKMDLLKLAKMLDLSFSAEEKDEDKEKKIEAAINNLKGQLAKLQAAKEEEEEEEEEDEEAKKKKADEQLAASQSTTTTRTVDPLLIKLSCENRMIKLNQLVTAGKMTPAVRDELAAKYANEKALAASLAKGDDGEAFDTLLLAFSKNDVVALGEQTRAQTLILSDPHKGCDNPLLKDAEARAGKK